jgi:hypothetical protein
VGAASSQGDFPVALPGITRTELADTIACVGGAAVVVVVGAAVVGALAAGFPLEPPHPATATASASSPKPTETFEIPNRCFMR